VPHADRPASAALPPLAAEDHYCPGCDLRYSELSVNDAQAMIADIGDRASEVCGPAPAAALRTRPASDVWSALEYLCHLRDVHATATIRLHRMRTEDAPILEPMLNDLRARRFRYNELDPGAVMHELDRTAAGFLDEIARMPADCWNRGATRLPKEWRSARWLVRHTAHEGVHHLADIRRVLAAALRSGSRR
jgi:DinB superfamily